MKIITLGEIMLRLSAPNHYRFIQTSSYDAVYGGGEANVAVSLANYGHDAYFVSKLPQHDIAQGAINELRKYGVNTSYIYRGGDRIGIYFLEPGSSMRPSKIIYDRNNSSFANAMPNEFDFDEIMQDADWFHFSGITPALSKNSSEITKYACEAAKKRGIKISCDLNYRKKLWTPQQAQQTMKELMKYVDVCIGNEEDAMYCLGFKPIADIEHGITTAEGYYEIFKEMKKQFNFEIVCSTLRESYSATFNGWKSLLYNGEEFIESKRYECNPITDRVGGGDSFSAGLIHGLLTKHSHKEALEFATAASALKHTIIGDFNLLKEDEVNDLIKGNSSGRVQR